MFLHLSAENIPWLAVQPPTSLDLTPCISSAQLDAAQRKPESLRGLEQEREYWNARADFDLEHAETDYARWRHVPVEKVDREGLEKWKAEIEERRQRHMDDLDRQKTGIEGQHGE